MQDAGWFRLPEEKPGPERLAEIFLNLEYESPFELLFYCYYSFPTRYPDDIVRLFGKEFFKEVIEPEAREGFLKIIQQEAPAAVLAFNKGVFNLVSKEPVGKYIARLKAGEVIQSKIRDVEKEVPIFLTYPTGWRYDPEHREYRRKSLEGDRFFENNLSKTSATSFGESFGRLPSAPLPLQVLRKVHRPHGYVISNIRL